MTAIKDRILSIDIMRGITLFLMLFVNDLFNPSAPKWMVHTAAQEDAMGLADWVFPGFLFMVGLSIPFAFKARESKNETTGQLLIHILIRTFSLLFIGVFLLNRYSYNEELTGLDQNLWSILAYVSVFLVWNNYSKISSTRFPFHYLKYIGVIGLIVLAVIFRSGDINDPGWMTTGWWGILGLIGWGYLVSAITYLIIKDKIIAIGVAWFFFIILNILSQNSMLEFLNPINTTFGVIISGNVPSIVLSGLLIGTLLMKYRNDHKRFISICIGIGLVCIAAGFALRNWFIISKILGTPSWAMLCNGISMILFGSLFYILDSKKWTYWSKPFLPAGQNSLTTYLAPDIIYFTIWYLGSNVLFYKGDQVILSVIGSLVWALVMIGFAAMLARMKIRLKL